MLPFVSIHQTKLKKNLQVETHVHFVVVVVFVRGGAAAIAVLN